MLMIFEVEGITDDAAKVDWEQSFSTMLDAEVNKTSSFYDERLNECLEGLKSLSAEISTVRISMYLHHNLQLTFFLYFFLLGVHNKIGTNAANMARVHTPLLYQS